MTLVMLIVGGILGWLASVAMRTDSEQGLFLNIAVGIAGAMLAGILITPFLGGAPITTDAFDLKALLVSLSGAVVLIGIVDLVRRGPVR